MVKITQTQIYTKYMFLLRFLNFSVVIEYIIQLDFHLSAKCFPIINKNDKTNLNKYLYLQILFTGS